MIFISIGRKNDVYETIHPTLNEDNDPQGTRYAKILCSFAYENLHIFYVLFVLDQPRSSRKPILPMAFLASFGIMEGEKRSAQLP